MDAAGGVSQYPGMRRRLLLVLVAIVLPLYLAVFAWQLSSGNVDVPGLIYALVTPSLVIGGVLLLLRRPGHAIGELLVVTGMTALVIPAIIEALTVGIFERSGAQEWMWAAVWLSQTLVSAGVVLAATLVVLLPDGRSRYQRDRRYVAVVSIVIVLPTLDALSHAFVSTSEFSFEALSGMRSPLFVQALAPYGPILVSLNDLAPPLVFMGAISLLFRRYRTAADREQKQIRWVLLAGCVVGILALAPLVLSGLGLIPRTGHSMPVLTVLSTLAIVLVPASVVVAVMDPPWIDVDIVIRRSVVYGLLSLAILLVYIAVAASVGVAAGAQLGLSVELAVVLTVIIAIVFQPARRRLQAVADRWVFGARPTRYEAVTDFGVTIEQATEPSDLLPRLVETISNATRLSWVTVSLDDGSGASTGSVTGEPVLRVPLRAGDEQVGEIACGPKTEGRLRDDDVQLVRTLAGQLALAIRNARLAGRIVDAAESERRRIERNIHDGAQQELVALVAKLGMARSAAAQGSLSPDVIDDMRLEAQRILSDLRELAQGIHPSVLSDGGILEAVEDRCARLPLEVTLETSDRLRARRFGDNIEGAAYFFVTESLANILKHAEAKRATVSLAYDDGRLLLGVADDGRGFDPDTTSNGGLAGLRDRIRALGGTITIASRPGAGTRITASLPANGQ
jgi:signal transduction histidine kinase